MEQKGNNIDTKLLGRVLALARPYRMLFAVTGILTLLLGPIAIVRPHLVKVAVDDYILPQDIGGLQMIILILCGFLLLEAAFRYAFAYLTSLLGQNVIKDLRVRVFDHVTELRPSYFDKTPVGTSLTRTINDVESINDVYSEGVITIIADVLMVVAVLSIMLYTSWQLTLVCLIPMPLLIWASYVFKEKVKEAFQIVRTQISRMNAFLNERITGMRIVQIFSAETDELKKFKSINRQYTQANIDTIFYYALFFPVVEILSASALGLMIWFGTQGVIEGFVSPGLLIAFPIYLGMLFRPIRMLADKFNTLQMGLVAAQRVFNLLDLKQFIPNNGKHITDSLHGKIELDKVWFSYNQTGGEINDEDWILRNVSFNVNPGETLAIVGSTGSGKTSVINLLNRFYEHQRGEIKVDGVNMEDYELYNYRKHICMVLQDVFLFGGTVYENIALRNPDISRETAEHAAKLVGAHKFIEQLPGAYDYKVMERGSSLSAGQRQLISFARALAYDPDILILDEATANIDPESEVLIQHAIETLIKKRTSIIIAHRLSTIRHANRVLVLDKGEVIEYGTRNELLALENGRFRKLHEMQFSEMETGENAMGITT
jgi:ATP-binding cassette, subfamily B, multidrug efflux pump